MLSMVRTDCMFTTQFRQIPPRGFYVFPCIDLPGQGLEYTPKKRKRHSEHTPTCQNPTPQQTNVSGTQERRSIGQLTSQNPFSAIQNPVSKQQVVYSVWHEGPEEGRGRSTLRLHDVVRKWWQRGPGPPPQTVSGTTSCGPHGSTPDIGVGTRVGVGTQSLEVTKDS